MKIYLLSMCAGLLVGVIYGLLNVRSPAPPIVALVGLFGILLGEQAMPLAKRIFDGAPINVSWFRSHCAPHIFGDLPTAGKQPQCGERPADRRIG